MNPLYLFVGLLMSSCSTYSAAAPPANHNGPLPTGTADDCARACVNLRAHHCPAGDPTPKGATCEAVCENTESSGYASENPRCIAQAGSCDQADSCADAQ